MIKRLAFERYIFELLKDWGIPVGKISRSLLSDMEGDPLERLRHLARFAVEQTGEERFGLYVGKRASNLSYGVFGHAMANCSSLYTSQRFMKRHLWLLQPVPKNAATLKLTDASLQLTYRSPPKWPELPDFFLDLFFSANLARSRELTADPISDAFLERKMKSPKDADKYSDVLGIEVRFKAGKNRISYPAELATRPLAADHLIRSKDYIRVCEGLLYRMEKSEGLTHQVRQLLLANPYDAQNMQVISRQLNLEIRTLRRHLKKEETSFRQIHQEVRCHLACSYLIDTDLSVADIANLVGFHDVPTFNRAFIAWIGETPPSYRRNNELHHFSKEVF